MGGFFGLFDYNKEGPGVYLNEPPKGPVKTFFAILGRKFWKLVILNIMYLILGLPGFAISLVGSFFIIMNVLPENILEILFFSDAGEVVQETAETAAEAVEMIPIEGTFFIMLAALLAGTQLVVFGPVHAGITYIFRNYSREEHAFLWGDFKEHLKKNWKQSFVTSLLGIIILFVMTINFSFYSGGDFVESGILTGVLTGAILIILMLFTIMQMYIYPMMVTFDVNIRQLYKNSALLAIAKLPSNVGILLGNTLILVIIPFMFLMIPLGGLAFMMFIFYYLFIGFGLNLLLSNFHVYRQLKKYMIDPLLEEEKQKEEEEKGEQEAIFTDSKPSEEEEGEE